jgi:hypothetical protein
MTDPGPSRRAPLKAGLLQSMPFWGRQVLASNHSEEGIPIARTQARSGRGRCRHRGRVTLSPLAAPVFPSTSSGLTGGATLLGAFLIFIPQKTMRRGKGGGGERLGEGREEGDLRGRAREMGRKQAAETLGMGAGSLSEEAMGRSRSLGRRGKRLSRARGKGVGEGGVVGG